MGEAEKVDPLIDETIGNYKVTRKIGEGGMGSVYLAEHPLIGKKVALKVLHPEFSSNEDVVTRFFNEAKAVNDIQHPNIVDIIDYGVIPGPHGDMVYFIMEHLDGSPLEDVIELQSPISSERSLHVCIQVADALAASHNSQIIHRDLKPDNIILIKKRNNPDFVKLLDFGIAKLTGDQPGSSRTRTGIVMGTPAYMSPEQCEGRGLIDKRTDVYALGIVLYQMLTGRVPFEGEGYGEVLVQHLTQLPPPPSSIRGLIPPHVEAVCMKALEKTPDNRFQCMEDFIAALTDPVAFVEANGGLAGFTSANLTGAIIPEPSARPGTNVGSGLYNSASSGNTQLGNVNSTEFTEDDSLSSKSKLPILIGIGALAAIVVVGIVLLRGDKKIEDVGPKNVVSLEVDKEKLVIPVEPEKTKLVIPEEPEKTKVVKVFASITSNPSGAEIYGPSGYIGKTPTKISDFESDDFPINFTIKKKGYQDTVVKWVFNPDQRKQRYILPEVHLTKIPRTKGKIGNKRETKAGTKKTVNSKNREVGDNTVAPNF